jgi:hypothetical protein
MNRAPRSDRNPEGCQKVAGGRNGVETSGVRTEMYCTHKGCQNEIARDRSMSPPVDRELRIIRNGCANVDLAPLLGAWPLGAVTGGFAMLRDAQPPAIIREPSGFNCVGGYVRASRSQKVALI